jgi:cation-transporting P-type ATPase C
VNAGASGGRLARAEPAHAVPGRVRFACRFRPDAPTDWPALARAAEAALPGVRSARASAAARSLVLFLRSGDSRPGVGALREALLRLPVPAGGPGGGDASAEPDPVEESRRALAVSALALLGAFLLPGPLRLPLTLAAGMPLLREGAGDLLGNGAVTSRVLEAAAVAISLGRGDHVAANTTTSLLALGAFLGETTARRSDRLLRGLLRPSDGPVWVLREDGTEIGVAAGDVAVGDAVVVGAGASVPVDGTVLSGAAEVDEAALTGEGAPVPKSRGARMLSGSVVRAGRIVVCAETVGADTAAARIAAFVERSLAAKGRAQMASAPPCCMGRRCGRTEPGPCSGSCDADVLRASQVEHPAQHVGGDGHLVRLPPVGLRPQPIADDALPPRDVGLHERAPDVPRGLLPAHAAV